METFGLTHAGWVRKNNEDRFLVRELSANSVLLAVADGMGGEAGGEVAAQIVTDTLANFTFDQEPRSAKQLARLIMQAHETIRRKASENPTLFGMGATATAALLDNKIVSWSHVGDSRLYHIQDQELRQVTYDHNMAGMMMLEGQLTPEQARTSPMRNVLTQCVGCKECRPDTGRFYAQEGDLLLLCSDGLHGAISHDALIDLVTSQTSIQEKAESLIQKALRAGGTDNITVVLAKI